MSDAIDMGELPADVFFSLVLVEGAPFFLLNTKVLPVC